MLMKMLLYKKVLKSRVDRILIEEYFDSLKLDIERAGYF